ncbi:MAG: LPS export ABC transporter periplasmic protein LptC [Bryobacteraceae bacterium]|nr:LPS export ABC transporter periplasmic protein LptC [Bryobacteraceae bacterium]
MRRTRWLILTAITFLLIAVGSSYYARVERLRREAPQPPPKLRQGIDAAAGDWVYRQNAGDKPVVEVRAREFEQIKEPNQFLLKGVQLRVFHKDGKQFDLITSAKADFDVAEGVLFSDGEVEIVMGVEEGQPRGDRLVKIETSGVRLETKTQRASTDREAKFTFEQGSGKATGAAYDPATRELHLKAGVDLLWQGKDAKARVMRVQAAEAIYKERESKVFLNTWSKLERAGLNLDGGPSVVTLLEGEIRRAEVQTARGTQISDSRNVEYAGDQLDLDFAPGARVTKIAAVNHAKLVSLSPAARTTVTSDRMDLDFDASGRESVLTAALARGHAVMESRPAPRAGAETPETKVLTSEVVQVKMRPGGESLDQVQTMTPGTLEFVPNAAGQARRTLNGDRIWIQYAANNQIETFRSVNVTTRTERPPRPGVKANPPAMTQSKVFLAKFDPATSKLSEVEQSDDFRYEEGDRRARSAKAILDQGKDVITLTGAARVWDSTGSTDADAIVLNQKDGGFQAAGNVASTRQPEPAKKKGSGTALLDEEQATQAKSDRMTASENNTKIRYEGKAILWQGANRLNADRIDIDRTRRVLEARGNVISQFVEQSKETKPGSKPAGPPVLTVVRAREMDYSEETRLAHYRGGARLTRPDLTVSAREIRAFLNEKDKDSSLEKAYADGSVEILQVSPERTRKGTSEHAQYFTADERVVLEGGDPTFADSVKGVTKGRQLTWFSRDDRLLVNGQTGQPAESTLRRK